MELVKDVQGSSNKNFKEKQLTECSDLHHVGKAHNPIKTSQEI